MRPSALLAVVTLGLLSCGDDWRPPDCQTAQAKLQVYGFTDCAALDRAEARALWAFEALAGWSQEESIAKLYGYGVEVGNGATSVSPDGKRETTSCAAKFINFPTTLNPEEPFLAHGLAHARTACREVFTDGAWDVHPGWKERGIDAAVEASRGK